MAVVLGNMMQKKEEKEMLERNALERKYSTLLNLIEQATEKLIPQVRDIYDTYKYIRGIDKEFAGCLWSYLCCSISGMNRTIDVSSYVTFGDSQYSHKVCLTRFGVSVSYGINGQYATTNNPIWDCNHHDERVFRGEYLLKDYLEDNKNELTDGYLEGCINELQTLLDKFPIYAKGFFDKVSNYQM